MPLGCEAFWLRGLDTRAEDTCVVTLVGRLRVTFDPNGLVKYLGGKEFLSYENDKTYLEIPVTIGIIGALLAPILAAVGAIAAMVAKAVRLTLRAAFPPARWVIKLDMFPPGQAATIIIPSAILALGSMIQINRKVSAGKMMNWDKIPSMEDFGSFKSLLKSDG